MKTIYLYMLAALAYCTLHACSDTKGHSHEQTSHTRESSSHTLFNNGYEVFFEYAKLEAGQTSTFLLHLTRLDGYKAVEQGKVQLELSTKANYTAVKYIQPGIYAIDVKPEHEGKTDLKIQVEDQGKVAYFSLSNILIAKTHDHDHDHTHKHENNAHAHTDDDTEPHEEEGIVFLKEQAWQGTFGLEQTQKKPFASVIRCSGELLPGSNNMHQLSAPVAGNLVLLRPQLVVGSEVKKGEALFAIVTKQLDNNMQQQFAKTKARYESALAHFQRDEKLLKEKIVSKTRFENTRANFLVAKSDYETISKRFQNGKVLIKAPTAGVLAKLLAREGQFVQSGQQLLSINRNKRIIIKGTMPKKFVKHLPFIQNAKIKTEYSQQAIDLQSLGGKRIQTSLNSGDNTPFIPIFFDAPYSPQLIPGSYAELYLEAQTNELAISVPNSALIESQSAYFVYVQTSGEHYEEREVSLGASNGIRTRIISGLQEGEWLVSQGGYRVKRASMSGAAPAHSHAH